MVDVVRCTQDMSFHEAELLALETLKEVMEEKISSINVEVACVKYV